MISGCLDLHICTTNNKESPGPETPSSQTNVSFREMADHATFSVVEEAGVPGMKQRASGGEDTKGPIQRGLHFKG